jgi:predicted Rossmann-fold nucleotide-binding protein
VSAIVSVFGSARLREGDAEYDDAREVGRLIAEAAVAWNLMQHAARDGDRTRPLVLVGARWAGMSETFATHLVDAADDHHLLEVVPDPLAVVARLKRSLSQAPKFL